MKVTLKWLNDYVKINDLQVDFIKDKLLNIGLEVESATHLGKDIENVVTGKITSLSKHSKADKLSVCLIDIDCAEGKRADGEINSRVKIVTGASNVREGDIVCVALDGAVLPGGKKILTADFRGELSQGMLCSGKELGITDAVIDGAEVDGLLILPPDTGLGLDVKQVLGLDDYVLDIAVTANRGDCHSIYGIARELAAALKRELKPLQLEYKTYDVLTVSNTSSSIINKQNINNQAVAKNSSIKVGIKNEQLCSKYLGSIVEDIDIRPSPLWLRRRLWTCGIGSKNNIVDITNYVLLEVGQPLHAFDLNRIEGNLSIRNAFDNEKIKALNGLTYSLDKNMLLIADDKKPLAIAGVMGGEYSGINAETKAVFVESARFARGGVRQTSRALGLRSDSSGRFEKGVDNFSVETGLKRALALIDYLQAGKVIKKLIKDESVGYKEKVIEIKYSSFKEILGIDVPRDVIKEVLSRLSFQVTETKSNEMDCNSNSNVKLTVETVESEINNKSNALKDIAFKLDGLKVVVPPFREDIDNFTDLIEEVIRFYGYKNLEGLKYKSGMIAPGRYSKRRENINKIENICCAVGAYEINNYSFIPARHADMLLLESNDSRRNAIRLINPISEDFAFMRTQLVSSMLETVRRNKSRQNEDFALFEIENVFITDCLPLKELPKENLTLCVGFCLKGKDFYDIKAFVATLIGEFVKDFKFISVDSLSQPFLHPGIGAEIFIKGEKAGYFGKIHPLAASNFETGDDVYIVELNLEPLISEVKTPVKFAALPKFPSVTRDFAVLVDAERPAGEIVDIIENSDTLVKSVEIFDIYSGEQIERGKKSIAFKVTLLNTEKTMTENEINAVCDKLVQNLRAANAILR